MGGGASKQKQQQVSPCAAKEAFAVAESPVGPHPELDAGTQEMIRARSGSRKRSWNMGSFRVGGGATAAASAPVVLSRESELQTQDYEDAKRLIKQQQEELARLRFELQRQAAEVTELREKLAFATDQELDSPTPAQRLKAREKFATRDLRGSDLAANVAAAGPRAAPSMGSRASRTRGEGGGVDRESARRRVIRNVADSRPHSLEVIAKGDETRELIWNVCRDNLLFSDLDEGTKGRLTDPFAPVECAMGDVVVRQGDHGEHFYVVESGSLRVFVTSEDEVDSTKNVVVDKEPWELGLYQTHATLGKYVASIGECAGFGELALMYDTPRAASVIACGPCQLWAIKRSDCKAVLQNIQRGELKNRVKFLRRVKIGTEDEPLSLGEFLTDQELNRLASVLESEVVEAGEIIVRQGQPGNHFYIVEDGECHVHQNMANSGRRASVLVAENYVKPITNGGYFGERALINEEPRAASVKAAARTTLLTLSRDDFVRHLGALADLVAAAHNLRKNNKGQSRRRMLNDTRRGNRLSARAIQIDAGDEAVDPDVMLLEDLTVLGTLGKGSFGVVRLVKHAETGKHYACKCQGKGNILKESMEPYVMIECKILAMCDNPFILKLYSTMQSDRFVYLVLELLEGGELYQHLQKMVCFPEPMLRFFVAQIVFAFDCLHGKDVLYRDLKPENLVLDSSGYIKVVDFGLSKVLAGWKTWTMCGTPEYLAPEILRNEGHNHGVDFWMLGVLTFELAHGKGPFVAEDEMALFELILKMRPKSAQEKGDSTSLQRG